MGMDKFCWPATCMGMLYFDEDLFGDNDSAYCGVGELGWDVYACGSCASLVLGPTGRYAELGAKRRKKEEMAVGVLFPSVSVNRPLEPRIQWTRERRSRRSAFSSTDVSLRK